MRLGGLLGIVNGEAKLSNPIKSSWGHELVSKQNQQSRKRCTGARGPVGAVGISYKAGQSAARESDHQEGLLRPWKLPETRGMAVVR